MLSTILKTFVVLFLVSTYKTLPFAYLIRFYALVFKHIVVHKNAFIQTRKNTFGYGSSKLDIFKAVSYSTYASPLEIDMYLHKSNSTYLIDLDIARTSFVCQLFQKLFMNAWLNETGEFKSQSLQNCPYIPVGTIQCVFKREIKLFQRYTITSNVLAWDNKWLYILSKFEATDGKLCALGITKYVFKKKGRITLRPREFIAECGMYNDEVEAINQKNYELVSHLESSEGLEELAARMEKS
ncbi:Thioesterase-like family protein [Clavispora lusitaniae]|uniref:Thioesterase n=1 Tax=Clavispora lusitaniae TaxID=36911 RepID=A0AA91PXF9_CLALS|nr:Thioesterase-like family protein [Clavispora lusitaniae]OVF07319.1 putative thioesterase [Clavispora lusitaniae]